jgi:hypothetical protein
VSAVAEAIGANTVQASTADYRRATVLSFALCGLLTFAGLLVPPSMSHDAGWGMQELRTLRAGGPFNSIVAPDPADISRDQASHVTWWSPGQYLIPGALTLLGLRLGTALTITAGVSLLCCLLGWIQVAKHFQLSPLTTTLVVAFIATFRYSTLPFGVYNGGEILLQGLTPWLILAGCRIPAMSALRAAALAFLAILVAFFAKLTGVMVASAALLAGSVEVLVRLRRITAGMVAGAVGATLGFGALYVEWFSRGTTPASGTGWSFHVSYVLFALGAPWGAGISWTDMLTSLLFNARHPLLRGGAENGDVSVILWLLLPPILLFLTVILKGWQQCIRDENLGRLLMITVIFYVFCAIAMSGIFLRGSDVSLEERHLRAAGTLIFVCVLAVASRLPRNSVSRLAAVGLCGLMSLYGCFAFAYRAVSTKRGEIDHYSETHQPSVDKGGIEFLRTAFAREGRDALFVLPSPDAASAFPPNARILSNHIEFDTEAIISARTYHGKVRGPLYVIMPTDIAQSVKGPLVLKEFVDYPFAAWETRNLGSSTVFVQQGTASLN